MKNNSKSPKNRSGGGRGRGPSKENDRRGPRADTRGGSGTRDSRPAGRGRSRDDEKPARSRGDDAKPARGRSGGFGSKTSPKLRGRNDDAQGAPRGRGRPDNRGSDKRPGRGPERVSVRPVREPRAAKAPRINHGPKPNLYGLHAVREAYLNPDRTIHALYLSDQAAELFAPVLETAASEGLDRPEPVVLPKEEIDRMLFRDSVHQGIAMAADPLEETFVQDLISIGAEKERSVIVVLDQVTDPHNVGAILRSACAFGATGAIMQRRHAPELDFIAAKTACGAVEHLAVAYETNLSRTLEILAEAGYTAIGLDEHADTTLGAMDVPDKCVLVLGAEGPGMRRLVKEHCSVLVRLPTQEPIASLNVSNAAAVALYALVKQ